MKHKAGYVRSSVPAKVASGGTLAVYFTSNKHSLTLIAEQKFKIHPALFCFATHVGVFCQSFKLD